MVKPAIFKFPSISFRQLETPFHKRGYRDYFAVVDLRELPDLSGWREINVREPKLRGTVPDAIRGSLVENPELFLFMNRGIVISAEAVTFDNKSSEVSLHLSDPKLHGLLDGGHTYNIAVDEREVLEEPQYVKIEILEGFKHEEIPSLVDARNTSNQVRDQSLMNLQGRFEGLKKVLKGRPYENLIAYKEYETLEDGTPKPIDVREIIAILTALDRENFDARIHPINAYRSRAACLEYFRSRPKAYEKLFPIAHDIFELYDSIHLSLRDLYNRARARGGEVTTGRFGNLTGVKQYDVKGKGKVELHFLRTESKTVIPSGFVYPVLGAFRALLEDDGGRWNWGKGMDPLDLLKGELGETLAETIGMFALEMKNPSKMGKHPAVWQSCHQAAQVAYLTN